jgi:diacylglycerol kinase (ATP)
VHYFILNKKSGAFSKLLLEKIRHLADQYFPDDYEVCYTKLCGSGCFTPEINREIKKDDVIVAIGGDGTVNLCLNYIYKHKLENLVSLGIIPRGTGNNMLLSLNLSKYLKKSFEILKIKKYQKLQYGVINKKYAFFNCSIGFSAYVLKNRKFKSRNGYVLDVINNFSYKPDISTLKHNNQIMEKAFFHGYFLNTTHYASIMPFMKYQCDDGQLRFFHSSKKNMLENVNLIIKTIQGQDEVNVEKAQKFLLTPGNNCFLEMDGDIIPRSGKYLIEVAGKVAVICG